MKCDNGEWREVTGRPVQILVADDDARLRASLAGILRDQGYEVTEADGGRQACALADQTAFDMALLDLRMPDLDGFGVMTHLTEKHPDCGVIVVSGEHVPREHQLFVVVQTCGTGGGCLGLGQGGEKQSRQNGYDRNDHQ